jgi:hypothetical protein
MNKLIEGKEYFLEIVYEPYKHKVLFFIKAKNKLNNSYSYINNLNCILSLFEIDLENYLTSESQWYINKNRAKAYLKILIDALNNTDFLTFLEHKLVEDRLCGEWENIETGTNNFRVELS